ncbi:hypothetical protein AVEN_15086-1 [Araneus ventricosus]|uniref:Uncharacterized protein n=1 Tax=Araneus ventricosus TaxID=182803 RepID=A0A4Y2QEQ5_ARAVE|nr:hypothetical protein AVEN_15086-1 [Araneus ventricosus]
MVNNRPTHHRLARERNGGKTCSSWPIKLVFLSRRPWSHTPKFGRRNTPSCGVFVPSSLPAVDAPCSKYPLSPVVGLQRIAIARGFVGWLERSGEISVNARTSKKTSRRTETSVQVYGLLQLVDASQGCNIGLFKVKLWKSGFFQSLWR